MDFRIDSDNLVAVTILRNILKRYEKEYRESEENKPVDVDFKLAAISSEFLYSNYKQLNTIYGFGTTSDFKLKLYVVWESMKLRIYFFDAQNSIAAVSRAVELTMPQFPKKVHILGVLSYLNNYEMPKIAAELGWKLNGGLPRNAARL